MLKHKSTNLSIALLLIFSGLGISETSSQYTRNENETSSVIIDLKGSQEDYNTTFKYPATDVLEASFIISNSPNTNDKYPEGLDVNVGNFNWKYDGKGYGALGGQKRFISDSISSSATFSEAGETEISLYLPTNASITEAQIDLTGLPYGSGELDDYLLASVNTNEGSRSYDASLSVFGDDYYTLWMDDGDLDTMVLFDDNLIFKSYTSDDWNDDILIKNTDDNEQLLSPTVSATEDIVVALWIKDLGSESFEMTYSSDNGQNWEANTDISLATDHYALYDMDMIVDSSDDIHVVWSGLETSSTENYQIFYSKSTDNGNTWASEIMLSDSDSSNSYSPKINQDDGKVHIAWEEFDDVNGYYQTQYTMSNNNGVSFSSVSKLSSSNSVLDVTVTTSGDDVLVGWAESDSSSGQINVKSRSSSNSGSSFNSEQTVSDGDDLIFGSLDSANNAGNNYYLVWGRLDFDLNYGIVSARSANKGVSWGNHINVDGENDEDFRASPSIGVNSNEVIVIWTDIHDGDGASNEEDIHYSRSTDDGTTWSSLEHISEHYYEADSSNPALAYSDNSLYICYIDDGDLNQVSDTNGNDANANDGDVFFRRSDNSGESWTTPIVISNLESDGNTEIDFASWTLDYRCDVTASSTNVHVSWSEIDELGYEYIYVRSSTDKGSSWSDPISIGADDGEGWKYGASIAANEDHVVAVWLNGPMGSDTDYDVYASYSNNAGSSWQSPIQISDESGTQNDYMPEIVYNNGKYHVVWSDCCLNYDILYSFTDNGGETWSKQKALTGPKSEFSYTPTIAAYEDNLYTVWLDSGDYDGGSDTTRDIVGAVSADNGVSWDEDNLIIDFDDTFLYKLPSISSGQGFTYLTYQDGDSSVGYDYFFTFSQDDGGTWSESFEITDFDSENLALKYNKMDTIVGDKAYFSFEEESNVFSEDHDDVDIYVRTTKTEDYPNDPYVKLGSSNDWQWTGQLDSTNSPVTWDSAGGEAVRSFKAVIEEALADAIDDDETTIDEYGVEMTEIILKVGSGSKGTVGFSDLYIEYNIDLVVRSENLVNALNTEVGYAQENENDVVETQIKISSDTAGEVTLKGLEIITTEADLSISDLSFSGDLIEGGSVDISAKISNDGQGSAKVHWEILNGDQQIKTGTVYGVEGGESSVFSYTWKDVPAGEHQITINIIGSVPVDNSEGEGDTVTDSLTIAEAAPLMNYEFITSEIPIENVENGWSLVLTNDGNKYCECITYLYVDDSEGVLLHKSDQTTIEIDGTKPYSGLWLPNKNVNNLWIIIEDISEGILVNEEIPIVIKKLPEFSITKIIWVDENDNEITSFSDGTVAYPKIYVMNKGSFDLEATAEISITNQNDKDLMMNYAGLINPNFGVIQLPAEEETPLLFENGGAWMPPSISFISGGTAGFVGEWKVNIKIENVKAINPNEQAWDSEELIFEDNSQTVEISTPPSLRMESFTSSALDINEGQAVTFTVEIYNNGGSSATGLIHLKQGNTVLTSSNFTVDGDSVTEVKLEYSVPQGYDGELNVEASIDRNSVYPQLGPQDLLEDDTKTLTLNVKGTVILPESNTEDSSGSLLIPLLAVFVLLVGSAGAFFFYRRSQGSGNTDDVFGDPEMMASQETHMAPPQSEQTTVAPPQPEQQPVAPPQPVPPAAPTLLSITVPPGVQPGQQIQIKAPDGRLVSVIIPEGLQPGAQFQVKI